LLTELGNFVIQTHPDKSLDDLDFADDIVLLGPQSQNFLGRSLEDFFSKVGCAFSKLIWKTSFGDVLRKILGKDALSKLFWKDLWKYLGKYVGKH